MVQLSCTEVGERGKMEREVGGGRNTAQGEGGGGRTSGGNV